ncbi:MAG: hypothetical protein IKW83_06995 [Muribaculaceae bacterium]|nr:hypothetical protein [Muribaculaceae bacterium]
MKKNLILIICSLVISHLILLCGCSSSKMIEKDENTLTYKVMKITPHKQFYEIDLKQGNNLYKLLSKRTGFVGNNYIKTGQKYSLRLKSLPFYSKRPSYIIIANDSVPIIANAGIYNGIIYTEYCNETLETSYPVTGFYEADKLDGLYLKE